MLTKESVHVLVRLGEYAKMVKHPYCAKLCVKAPGPVFNWRCTREQGHKGEHVAHIGKDDFVLRVWDDKHVYYENDNYERISYKPPSNK